MKIVDQTLAMFRMLVQGSDRDTISEEAKLQRAATREERQKARLGMDALIADLIRTGQQMERHSR